MKDGAIVCNSGHFDIEIDIPAFEKLSKEEARTFVTGVEQYMLDSRRTSLFCG